MADLSIRNLDDDVRELLRRRAAEHGRSMESEVRAILTEAVRPGSTWLESWHRRFQEVGGVDLKVPARRSTRRPPDWPGGSAKPPLSDYTA
ncbi:MAG: FitA-like ribbon-helix-helix domain-containing protein [Actinomycetota bacterium]